MDRRREGSRKNECEVRPGKGCRQKENEGGWGQPTDEECGKRTWQERTGREGGETRRGEQRADKQPPASRCVTVSGTCPPLTSRTDNATGESACPPSNSSETVTTCDASCTGPITEPHLTQIVLTLVRLSAPSTPPPVWLLPFSKGDQGQGPLSTS